MNILSVISDEELEDKICGIFISTGEKQLVSYFCKEFGVESKQVNRILSTQPDKYERTNPNQGAPTYRLRRLPDTNSVLPSTPSSSSSSSTVNNTSKYPTTPAPPSPHQHGLSAHTPWAPQPIPLSPQDSPSPSKNGDMVKRLQKLWDGMPKLKKSNLFEDEYFPEDTPKKILKGLKKVKFTSRDKVSFFELNAETGEVCLHPDFLKKLHNEDKVFLEYFLLMFLVHEFIHPHQGTNSYNYKGIGRTGFALGMDEYADSMAAYAATTYRQKRVKEAEESESWAESNKFCWDLLLKSITLFDTFPLQELPTQDRMDRYLTTLVRRGLAERVKNKAKLGRITSQRWHVGFRGFAKKLNEEEDVVVDMERTKAQREKDIFIMWSVNSGTETRKITRDPGNLEPMALLECFIRGELAYTGEVAKAITYMLINCITKYREDEDE